MDFRESVKAYRKAGHAAEYHWWSRDEAIPLLETVLAKLDAASPDAKFCIRPGLKDNGEATLWLYVQHSESEASGDITIESHDPGGDLSHPCPPAC